MPMLLSFKPAADSRLTPLVGWAVRLLIVYSVVSYMVEVQVSAAENSRLGDPRWLWNERLVAGWFTFEYLVRIVRSRRKAGYLLSGFGLIDLLSIVPFWLGFFLPTEPTIYLRLVRACRILRLLKMVRYMPRVQLLLRALISCWNELLAVGFVCFVVFLFGSTVIWEIERYAQPDKYGSLGNAMWWMMVTLTTIGYGDVSPVTPLGKLVAVVIMAFGIGCVAGFVGIIANTIFHVFNPTYDMPQDLKEMAGMSKKD